MSLKLPPEFRPTTQRVGRRTYNLAYAGPRLDADLRRNMEEAAAAARYRPILIEIVGEGHHGSPSFSDELLELFGEKGFATLSLPCRYGHQNPLSLIRQLLGLDDDGSSDYPEELRRRLWLLEDDPAQDWEYNEEHLAWLRLRLVNELLHHRFPKPTVVDLSFSLGEIDHESLSLLERVLESIHDLCLVILLNYDERVDVPEHFGRLDSYFIRFVPELNADHLGSLGDALFANISHEQFDKYLQELSPSLSYAEQLVCFYELDLDGGFDRRLNHPLTPIQLFLFRWQKLSESQQHIMLALALRRLPCDARRLSAVTGQESRALETELAELKNRRLLFEIGPGYILADPKFYTWSVDFSNGESTETFHRRHLGHPVADGGFDTRLSSLEHRLALQDYDEAYLELNGLLDYLLSRGLARAALLLESHARTLLSRPLARERAFTLLVKLAQAALDLRDTETASRLLEDAAEISSDLEPHARGRLELLRGRLADQRNRIDEALERYTAAATDLKPLELGARALREAVNKARQGKQHGLLDELIARFPDYDSPLSPLLERLSRAETWRKRDELDAATQVVDELLLILRKDDVQQDLHVDALLEKGRLTLLRGSYNEAQEYITEALEKAVRIGFAFGEFSALSLTAQIDYQQGRLQEAIEGYLRSLTVLDLAGHDTERLSILNNLGLIYHSWGFLESALACLETCEERLAGTNDYTALSFVWCNLGLVWLDLGKVEKTQHYIKFLTEGSGRRQLEGSGDSFKHYVSLMMGRIAEQQSDYGLAERLYRQVSEHYQRQGVRFWKLIVDVSVARTLRVQGRLDEARALMDDTIAEEGEPASRRLIIAASIENAERLLVEERFEAAEEQALRALELVDPLNIPDSRFQLYWLLTRIQRAMGKENEARHSYNAAREDLEHMLSDFYRDDLRDSFLERRRYQHFLNSAPAEDG